MGSFSLHVGDVRPSVTKSGRGEARTTQETSRFAAAPQSKTLARTGGFLLKFGEIPCQYVAHRISSEEGRCFRIHFKAGPAKLARDFTPLDKEPRKPVARKADVHYTGLQVAPAGSLAYGFSARGNSNGPEVGKLFREFFDGRKPGFVPKRTLLNL